MPRSRGNTCYPRERRANGMAPRTGAIPIARILAQRRWNRRDRREAPTQILLCDSSCSGIELDATGSVNITLGCSTVIL